MFKNYLVYIIVASILLVLLIINNQLFTDRSLVFFLFIVSFGFNAFSKKNSSFRYLSFLFSCFMIILYFINPDYSSVSSFGYIGYFILSTIWFITSVVKQFPIKFYRSIKLKVDTYIKDGLLDTALQELPLRIVKNSHDDFEVRKARAYIYFLKRDFKKALKLLHRLESRNEMDWELAFYLGHVYYSSANPDIALKYYTRAYNLDPDQTNELYILICRFILGEYTQVIEMLEKITLDKNNPLYLKGLCYEGQGRTEQAIDCYNRAQKKWYSFRLDYRLATLALQSNDPISAKKNINQAIKRSKNFTTLNQHLDDFMENGMSLEEAPFVLEPASEWNQNTRYHLVGSEYGEW